MSGERRINEEVATGTAATEIVRLVDHLNCLEEGDKTVAKLILRGPAAIEPLKDFLFLGKPSVIYQPRRWAIEALEGIGAKEALAEYLKWKKYLPDPAVRLAEEAVENAAAKALGAWGTDDVFQALLEGVTPQPRIGLVEALGEFKRAEPIPYFIHALEDDVCRSAAAEALRKLGSVAVPHLLEAAVTRIPSPEEETPSSVLRRVSALKLLGEIELTLDSWPLLRPLLSESPSDVVIAAADIASKLGNPEDKTLAVRRLLEILPSAEWSAREEIETCLVRLYPAAKDILDRETTSRNSLPDEHRVQDRALRTLLRVRRRIEAAELRTS